MKRLVFYALACMTLLAGLVACSNSNDPMESGNHRDPGQDKGKLYTVSLSMGGDYVEEADEPLTKATTQNSYVGINVTRLPEDGSSETKEQYAHGVFTSKEGIDITLVSGFLYTFEATVLTDNDDIYTLNKNSFQKPFLKTTIGENNPVGYDSNDADKFIYSTKVTENVNTSDFWLCMLSSGTAYVNSGNNNIFTYDYPRVHRYYGISSDYNPSSDNPSVKIDLKYKSFGLKVVGENIPEGTSVTWKDVTVRDNGDNNTLKFPQDAEITPENNSWESIYSLNHLTDLEKSITLEFTWHKGGDLIESFRTTTTVKAKYRKTLKVDITGTANTTKNGNITLDLEDSKLVDDEEIVSNISSN